MNIKKLMLSASPLFVLFMLMFIGGALGLFVGIYVIQETGPIELFCTIVGGMLLPLAVVLTTILIEDL